MYTGRWHPQQQRQAVTALNTATRSSSKDQRLTVGCIQSVQNAMIEQLGKMSKECSPLAANVHALRERVVNATLH